LSDIPTEQDFHGLLNALQASALIETVELSKPLGNAVFIGSGDSLASALVAHRYGHRSMSSGDITWTEQLPARVDTIVGISHSGTSGATVCALRLARAAGVHTVAITSNPDSPIAQAADDVQIVPMLTLEEAVPSAGHIMLALGVAAVCGETITNGPKLVAEALARTEPLIEETVASLGIAAPASVSVLTLTDLRSAGDFLALKLMEATGVAARLAPLEESGHVDYFIGPQLHIAVQLISGQGRSRHERLKTALVANGQKVIAVDLSRAVTPCSVQEEIILDITAASFSAFVSHGASVAWGRPPFRGGAVNMDASHIKLQD
jgi:fructoselysine-6-P-deglycase FrlB-like protein